MSGRLTLAATGKIDEWLTKSPVYSHFLTRFKRHTKFSVEQKEHTFDGTIDWGKEVTVQIPNSSGDMIRKMTLRISLWDPTPDYPYSGQSTVNDNFYPPSVCTHMIEYCDLVIGQQTISRIRGEWIYMQQQLSSTNDDVEQTQYFLNGMGQFLRYSDGYYTYYLDLPFFFDKNPALSIPNFALTKQRVSVRLKIRPLEQMIYAGYPTNLDLSARIQNLSLNCEMGFITDQEKAYMMTRPMNYVIQTLHMSEFKMKQGENKKSVMLNFDGPVREMYVVSQNDRDVEWNIPINFNTIKRLRLELNGAVAFDYGTKYLTYVHALRKRVNCPRILETSTVNPNTLSNEPVTLNSEFAMYSWANDPTSYHYSGAVNFSRIRHKLLTVEITPQNANYDNKTRVYVTTMNVLTVFGGVAGLKF
jgi:hypothetical protein